MKTLLVATTSHNNLSTRGEESLTRMIDSVRTARTVLEQQASVKVLWSWVDDGSTDGTAEWLADRLRRSDREVLLANEANIWAAAARNLAVGRLRSDYVNLFDSDDEMYPHHFLAGIEALEGPDHRGLRFGVVSTKVDVAGVEGDGVHPGWLDRISTVQVDTTFYHRGVWDFVEGMPSLGVYRETGCEDQDLLARVTPFFPIGGVPVVTARYWCYPGSYLERQLPKFRHHPDVSGADEAPLNLFMLQQAREAYGRNHRAYLKVKLATMADRSAFDGLVRGTAFTELGLMY